MGNQDIILRIDKIAEDTIIRATEENFLSYISVIPSANNNIILDTDTLLLISTGIVGRLVLPCNDQTVKNIIDLITSPSDISWLWCVGPSSKPDNLTILLKDCGCVLTNTEQGMFLNLIEFKNIPISNEVSISLVNSLEQLDDFTQVFAEYWDIPDMNKREEYLRDHKIILHPEFPIKLFIGYHNNKPVTICELLLKNGVAGIYSVTTLQNIRHQGFATNVLSASLAYAKSQGYEIATLLSSAAGKKLYTNFGFKESCLFYRYRSK